MKSPFNMARLKTVLIRWLKRGGLTALFFLTTLFFSAIAVVYSVLNTEGGTRWAISVAQRFLPELTFTHAKGSLLRGLNIEQIRWHDKNIDIEINQVQLRLRFHHLLHGEIHLQTLQANVLKIIPLGPPSNEPTKLSRLFLPFLLSTPDLTFQRLDIVDNESIFSLHDIHGAVQWRATTLTLRRAAISWQDMLLQADGDIGFRGNYPLHLNGKLTLPQWPRPIAIQSRGDLRHLELQASTAAPYKLSAQIKLATLDKHLPLQIHAELVEAISHDLASDKISINKTVLDANGDLTRVQIKLAASISDSRYGNSELTANADWRGEQIAVDAQWLPASGRLQLHCDGTLQKPFAATCNGDATELALSPWLNGQTAVLSSTLALEAKWLDPKWMFAIKLPDIKGKYNDDAISGVLDLRTDDGAQWQLRQFALNIGPNSVKGDGEFGTRYRLRAMLNANDLARIDPRLSGKLAGTIAVDGNDLPTVNARLRGSQLQWDKMRAGSAALNLNLVRLGNAKSIGQIDIRQLTRDGSPALDLTLEISGKREEQRWNLHAAHRQQYATLKCATQSKQPWREWQFICDDFSGNLQPVNRSTTHSKMNLIWHNTEALRGNLQLTLRNAELSPFCLRGDGVEVCLDQTLRISDAKPQSVAMHASGLPLRWASAWFPDTVELLDDARASLQLQLRSLAPLDAQANLFIPATHWQWRTLKSTENAEIDAIHLDANLNSQRALFITSAQSPRIGRIAAQLAVNDPTGARALDGHIGIEQLQLAGIAWAFEGLDSISGEINGAIEIKGSASAPQLYGQLLLKDGEALWAPLGAPFRTVHADLTFDNNSAKLGGWFALGQGGGDIDGNIDWDGTADNWKARLGLIAGGVSAMPLPNSTVVFSPHTELTALPGEIHIDGYVDIASAEIQLKQLPPQTTDVSQDQEIVGEKIDEGTLKVWTKLDLNLGDQFHLNGFGADVNLNGRLQLNKTPGDNTHLYGEVKVPRGRYRAYGQRLTVRKGSVIFYGPLDNPDLNLEAVRDMPPGVTDVVGLRVIGSLKTPEAILFSEPSMPDSDIAYYLLTGHKPIAGTNGTSGYSASGALLSLGLAGSESKAGQLAQKFGITDLQLGTSEGTNGNSEAEISGQLGKDLFVRYGRGLGQQSNSFSFQYRLTPKLMIETISGIEDALDLLYSFEIK